MFIIGSIYTKKTLNDFARKLVIIKRKNDLLMKRADNVILGKVTLFLLQGNISGLERLQNFYEKSGCFGI